MTKATLVVDYVHNTTSIQVDNTVLWLIPRPDEARGRFIAAAGGIDILYVLNITRKKPGLMTRFKNWLKDK